MTFMRWAWSRFDAGMARKVVNLWRRLTPVTGLLDPRVAVQRPFQVALEFSYGM
jgi:hypothetical protein